MTSLLYVRKEEPTDRNVRTIETQQRERFISTKQAIEPESQYLVGRANTHHNQPPKGNSNEFHNIETELLQL